MQEMGKKHVKIHNVVKLTMSVFSGSYTTLLTLMSLSIVSSLMCHFFRAKQYNLGKVSIYKLSYYYIYYYKFGVGKHKPNLIGPEIKLFKR